MDGSAAAGSPSGGSSGPLPAPADEETLPRVSENQDQDHWSPAEHGGPPTESLKLEGSSNSDLTPDQPEPEPRKADPDPGHPELTEKPPKLDPVKPDPLGSDQKNKRDPAEPEQEPGQNRQEAEEPPPLSEDLTGGAQESKTLQNLQDPDTLQAPPPADHQAPPLTVEVFGEQAWPRPPASPAGEPKLCGYLLKQAGPLRSWKQRWFTYEEKKNQLFYYRTPQDVTPLGRVDLSAAVFTYPLKAETGTFHIKTPERTFILKVGGPVPLR